MEVLPGDLGAHGGANPPLDDHGLLLLHCGICSAIVILAIVSKIATGLFAGAPNQPGYGLKVLQVGAAMVGRGELGFMQISTAYKMGIVFGRLWRNRLGTFARVHRWSIHVP